MPVLERPSVETLLGDIACFSDGVVQKPLRPYQEEIARAVIKTVLSHKGDTLTVMMARQMGKNELSAHIDYSGSVTVTQVSQPYGCESRNIEFSKGLVCCGSVCRIATPGNDGVEVAALEAPRVPQHRPRERQLSGKTTIHGTRL